MCAILFSGEGRELSSLLVIPSLVSTRAFGQVPHGFLIISTRQRRLKKLFFSFVFRAGFTLQIDVKCGQVAFLSFANQHGRELSATIKRRNHVIASTNFPPVNWLSPATHQDLRHLVLVAWLY
jgi:hypothetical protein